MKIQPIASFIITFMIAGFAGFKSGADLGTGQTSLAGSYTTPRESSPATQHNILLIHTDQIDTNHPNLKSVWLMVHYYNSPRVDLLPIFPLSKPGAEERNRLLADSFQLTPKGEPGDQFWLGMETINTWWNAYVLLDDIAAEKLIKHLGSQPVDAGVAPIDFSTWKGDLQVPIDDQATLYRSLCQDFSHNANISDFFELLVSLNQHTNTNLKPGQLFDVWQLLGSYGQGLKCNFPSIRAAIP